MFDAIWNIKPRFFGLGGVANPRDSYGYRCSLRLALGSNPSLSSCPDTSVRCTSPGSRAPLVPLIELETQFELVIFRAKTHAPGIGGSRHLV